jgi:hypothetical protein
MIKQLALVEMAFYLSFFMKRGNYNKVFGKIKKIIKHFSQGYCIAEAIFA